MKQLLFVCTMALLASCNDAGTTETKKDSSSTAVSTPEKKNIPEMPYQLKKPYKNWQPGDPQHAYTVMSSLKGFETGDMAKCMEGFADSVSVYFDNWEGRYSKDSLGKMMSAQRASMNNMRVTMEDWESVIAADKSEEYVTLWYKQVWTDKNGKTDSVACINDAMIKNGKVAQLSEAVRHYPAKK